MASKIRPILQAVKGGCRRNSPRAACRAANALRNAGSKVQEEWPRIKAQGAYEACRVAKVVRKAGSKVQDQWPGIKTKAQDAYEVWKNSVDAGDEFIIRIHKTGKIIVLVTAPFALLKIAYSEYTRSDETADPGSQYEQTRAAAMELLHYADPALSRLVQFFFPDLKKPEPATDHDREFSKRVLREVDETYQEGLPDAFDHMCEKLQEAVKKLEEAANKLKEEEANRLKEEEEANKLKEEEEATKKLKEEEANKLKEEEANRLKEEEEANKLKEEEEATKKLKEEEAKRHKLKEEAKKLQEDASSGMMAWISRIFWGTDTDSAVSDKSPAGADAAGDNKGTVGGPHGGVATSTGKGADPGSSGGV